MLPGKKSASHVLGALAYKNRYTRHASASTSIAFLGHTSCGDFNLSQKGIKDRQYDMLLARMIEGHQI